MTLSFYYFLQPQRDSVNRGLARGFNPFRVVEFSERFPRVASREAGQPWAECCYPVGVEESRSLAVRTCHGIPET